MLAKLAIPSHRKQHSRLPKYGSICSTIILISIRVHFPGPIIIASLGLPVSITLRAVVPFSQSFVPTKDLREWAYLAPMLRLCLGLFYQRQVKVLSICQLLNICR